jgi:hypothetical protein
MKVTCNLCNREAIDDFPHTDNSWFTCKNIMCANYRNGTDGSKESNKQGHFTSTYDKYDLALNKIKKIRD